MEAHKTGKYDDYISIIRVVALCMIIICHILMVLNNELQFWFNVGVQIFLCVSGFLYGRKNIEDTIVFYRNRFLKILVPYYISIIFFSAICFALGKENIALRSLFKALICNITSSTIEGAGHLWFIPLILMCYVLTPLFQLYFKKYAISRCSSTVLFVIISFFIAIFFGTFATFFNPAWVCCYFIGYFLGFNETKHYIPEKILILCAGIVAVVGNAIQIYCDYIAKYTFRGGIETLYRIICKYNHVFLGVFLFLILKKVIIALKNGDENIIVTKYTDAYSFEIYLVNLFVIKGPFSLINITSILPINIIIILSCILGLAFLLKILEDLVFRTLKKDERNLCELP